MSKDENEQVDLETLSDDDLETLSKLMRVLDGESPNPPDEIITSLTNPKNILERTRFPTHPLLQKNVYLRLVAAKHPELTAFKEWADSEAEALISYKGEGRKEWVEQRKAAAPEAGTVIGSYSGQQQPQQPQKKHWWNRGTHKPQSEFVNQ